MSILEELQQSVINGETKTTGTLAPQALRAGLPADHILKEGLIAAMAKVGKLFEDGEFFVPEMLIVAHAMKAGLTLLRPHLAEANVQAIGKEN